MNVIRNIGFDQVVVWPCTLVDESEDKQFEYWIKNEFNVRAQYLETVSAGQPLEGVQRVDVLFAVHNEDIGRFALPRLQYGMRWLEDVYLNNQGHLYPDRVAMYKSW